jgi:RNA polymerase sigma-70 factor (ECF subfamily)
MQRTFCRFEEDVIDLIPALRRFAVRFTWDEDLRNDLVQETVTRAIAKSEQFTPGTYLRSWLFTILRNTFNTEFKKRQREPVGYKNCASTIPGLTLASHDWVVRLKEVQTQIDRLSDEQRQLILNISAGATYQDVADEAHCDVGTIKSRVHRARCRLMVGLGEKNFADCASVTG